MTVSGGRSRARRWGVQRSRARGPVVAALAALVLVTSVVLTGIAGYTALAGRDGLRDYLRSATGLGTALQLRTRLGDDDQEQQARTFFDRELGSLPVRVERAVTVAPQRVGERTARLAAYADLPRHARLVDGSWSAKRTGDVQVPATEARALGVGVGDSVVVAGIGTLSVSAVWRPRTADDPVFHEVPTDGTTEVPGLPLVVAEQSLGALSPAVTWTVVPDVDAITVDDVAPLSRAVDRLPDALDADSAVAPSGVLSDGTLGETLRTLDRSQQAALAMRPVPVVVVAALGVLMLLQLAGLLARQRGAETALLRSRGASGAQLTRLAVAEAAVLAVAPAGLGAAVTALALAGAGAHIPLAGWLLAAATAAASLVAIALPGVLQTRRTADRQQIDDSGRRVALSAGATVLAVVVAAAVATWRFRTIGAATFRDSRGTTRVDPIAVLAPGLLLLAGALLATAVFAAGAVAVERVAARRTGLATVLAARQLARRATTYGVLVLLLTVAVGATTLAAAYAPTQADAQRRLDALGNGAAVRVVLPADDPMDPASYDVLLPRLRALRPVGAALPVQDRPVGVGTTDARLLGVEADRLGTVLPRPVADLGGELRPTRLPARGARLPDGTRSLHLRVTAAGSPSPLSLSLWVQAPDGSLQVLAAGQVTAPATAGLAVDVPDLPDGSRVVGIDATSPRATAQSLALQVDGLTARTGAGEQPVALGGWRLFAGRDTSAGTAALAARGTGWTLRTEAGAAVQLRLVPAGGTQPMPVVVDRRLGRELLLRRGSTLSVGIDSARLLPSRVVAVVDQLPGAQDLPVVATDLATLSGTLLDRTFSVPSTTAVWVAGRSEGAAAAAVGDRLPPGAAVVRASSRSAGGVVAPASFALWLGAAGTLLLALVGAVCVTASAAEARRDELVVLRAVGVGPRSQARARRVELLAVVLTGSLLGVVVGAVTTGLAVPGLAGSTLVGDAVSAPPIAVAWIPLVLLLGLLVAPVLLVVAAHARRTRLDALASTPSEVRR